MNVLLNGELVSIECRTIGELIVLQNLTGKRIAVECNGRIVPKSLHANTLLADGDRIEIVVAVGGG